MAITVDIDENGNRKETVGGVAQLVIIANNYAANRLNVNSILVGYAPGNFHIVTMRGRYVDGTTFDLQSSPTDPAVSLGTIVVQLVDKALALGEKINAVTTS